MSRLKRLGRGLAVAAGLIVLLVALLMVVDLRSLLAQPVAARLSDALGRTVAIDGAVHLGAWRGGPSLILKDVRLANASWGSAPDMLTIGRVDVRVAIRPLSERRIVVSTLALRDATILLETDFEGLSNRPRPGRLRIPERPIGDFALEGPHSVVLQSADFTYRPIDGRSALVAKIERAQLEPAREGLRLEIFGVYRKALVALEGTIERPLALIRGEATPVKLAAAVGTTTILIAGDLASPLRGPGFALELDGKAPNLVDLAGLIGITGLPDDTPLAFSVALRSEGPSVNFDEFSATLGEGTLVGAGEVEWDADGLTRVDGVFASEKIDLGMLAGHTLSGLQAPQDPEAPLPLDRLRRLHLDLSFQADSLLWHKAAFSGVDMRLLLADGVLTAYPVTLSYAGASVDLELSADFTVDVPHAELRGSTRSLDLGRLFQEASKSGAPPVLGLFDGSVELRSRGASVAAFLGGLEGEAAVTLTNGSLEPRYVERLPDAWRAPLRAMGEGEAIVPLDCALARVAFAGGKAETRALVAETGQTRTGGRGVFDLVTGGVEVLLAARPKEASRRAAARDLTITGSLKEPVFGLAESLGPALSPGGAGRCDLGLAGVLVPKVNEEPNMDPETAEALRTNRELAPIEGSD